MTSSSIERLKAAAAKTAAAAANPAATTATAPASAPAAPVAPTPTAPSPAAALAALSTPAAPTTPAATAPVASAPSSPAAPALVVPQSVTTDDEARAMLALLHGQPEGDDLPTPSELFDEVDGGGGLAFSHPFAQVRKGNWSVHKSCPQTIYDFMPAGQRPFNMIFLGYRVGATAWAGTPGDGKPPAFKYAIPHRRMNPASTEMTRQTLQFGSKIQYKKIPENKYMHLGKLVPEIHIFGWTPETSFMILAVSGFKPSELTSEGLSTKTVRDMEGMGPLCFTVEAEITENTKVAADAKNRKWTDHWIKAEFQPTEPKSTRLYEAWEQFKAASIKDVANQCIMFHKGIDYHGLNQDEIGAKLKQYQAACA